MPANTLNKKKTNFKRVPIAISHLIGNARRINPRFSNEQIRQFVIKSFGARTEAEHEALISALNKKLGR